MAVVLLALGTATVACGAQSEPEREARWVFKRVNAAAPCWPGTFARTSGGIDQSCDVTLAGQWDEYRRSVNDVLRSRYDVRTETASSVTFSRLLEGDVYAVHLERATNAENESARVTFRARPW
jgi:hypothetical protein